MAETMQGSDRSLAILLAMPMFTFTNLAENSKVLSPAQHYRSPMGLEHDAEVMSNTKLEQQLARESPAVQDEIIRINTDARPRALQVALLVPLPAALAGLANAFRMRRQPDPVSSGSAEGMAFG
jgi:hypothetical protein